MRNNYILIFLYFFVNIVTLTAQNSEEILCKILDVETKYPVSFATVQFEGSNNGVIADEDGGFRLPIEFMASDKRLIISSIGFETLTLFAKTLNLDVVNTIYLRPKVEALSTVLVIAETKTNSRISSPKGIIEEAIKRIAVNYPRIPHSYIGYYRDYQLVNDKYYNLNESILETFDAGFHTSKYGYSKNVTAMYSYNRNESYFQDSLLQESVYGDSKIINKDQSARFISGLNNELEILNSHNPIRNYNKLSFSFIDKLRDDFINNHVFKLEGIKYVNDIPLFEISFASNEIENVKFRAKGKIYINKANYAIYKIVYKMIENERFNNIKMQRNNRTKFESRERLSTLYEINVEYKPINDKMYLNYMTFNNRFIIKEPNPFKVKDFEFNPKDKAFYITFNKSVDETSIERRSRFRLLYKGKKLIIKTVELVDSDMVKVEVIDWAAGTGAEAHKVKPEDFSYRLKKIKDITGGTLDKETKLLGFQFREFFTQQVFENKEPLSDFIYVIKSMPLRETNINSPNFDINKYWVNSPLKQTKDLSN